MLTFEEFMENVDKLQENKAAAQEAVETLSKELTRLEDLYDIQTVIGDDTKDIKDDIYDIKIRLAVAERKLEAFTRNPNLIEVLKENKSIEDQAIEIMDRNQASIGTQQQAYYEKSAELVKIKNDYIRAVRDLGKIVGIAEHYAKEQNILKQYVRTRENTFYQGVSTGINELRKTGITFISPDDILKEFKSGNI